MQNNKKLGVRSRDRVRDRGVNRVTDRGVNRVRDRGVNRDRVRTGDKRVILSILLICFC